MPARAPAAIRGQTPSTKPNEEAREQYTGRVSGRQLGLAGGLHPGSASAHVSGTAHRDSDTMPATGYFGTRAAFSTRLTVNWCFNGAGVVSHSAGWTYGAAPSWSYSGMDSTGINVYYHGSNV